MHNSVLTLVMLLHNPRIH